jgi:anion-transporting  ArsA/GET3 family ATPase
VTTRREPTRLDLDTLLDDPATRILVCCGAGGVGKTTTAAAVGLRAAERGRKVVVLTIDPARRLAQSLGLVELDNTPRTVQGIGDAAGGRLDAMMLDMKRTFDDVVVAHSSPDKAAQILENPFYQAVSTSFAGTQEYMAMEKLGQLRTQADRDGRWDLIVVDTPPSRSALDFLDAPNRLGSFLDGRFIRLISAPARASGRVYLKVLGAGIGLVSTAMTRILGGQMLGDVQTFVAALDSMFGGFRERADHTYGLLKEGGTAFVVVAAPERDALREAAFFVERLAADDMPLAGVVINRMQQVMVPGLTSARALGAAERLGSVGSATADEPIPATGPAQASGENSRVLAAGLLRLHADLTDTSVRQRRLTGSFAAGHPGIPMVEVPALSHDVHDLDSLREVGLALAVS